MRYNYENIDNEFDGHYSVDGFNDGIAFFILGYQTEPDEDTEWSGYENRTGMLVAIMVGDDLHHLVEPDDLTEINDDEYCSCCGQIGCQWG